MKIKFAVLIIVIFAFSICHANEGVSIRIGFGTGLDYIEMNENQKQAYMMGAINGMLVSPIFGASKEKLDWLENFISGMSSMQAAAILTKFLNDNPGKWNQGLHMLTFNALKTEHTDSQK